MKYRPRRSDATFPALLPRFRRLAAAAAAGETHNQEKNPRRNKVQTSRQKKVDRCEQANDIKAPALPQETALETVKFNKIIKLGRGREGETTQRAPPSTWQREIQIYELH